MTYKLCQGRKNEELNENLLLFIAGGLSLIPSFLLFEQCQNLAPELTKYPAVVLCASGVVTVYAFFKIMITRNYYTERRCVIEGMEETLPVAESAYIASFTATKKANKQYKLGLRK